MKFTKILAGILLAAAVASASAAVPVTRITTIVLDDEHSTFGDTFAANNNGKSFLDIFYFTIGGNSSVGSSLTSTLSGTHDLNITSFGLYSGETLLTAGTMIATGAVESWTLDALAPSQGTYSLRVGVNVIGKGNVGFAGDGYVTAVPEPETWGMVVGSVAILAFIGRRRKPTAPSPLALAA